MATQYLVDESGIRLAVVLDLNSYNQLLQAAGRPTIDARSGTGDENASNPVALSHPVSADQIAVSGLGETGDIGPNQPSV